MTITLRKAFENLKKEATKMANAQSDFSTAYGKSKYSEIELPDDIVDVVDYAQADMTFEEFKDRMDELLKEGKRTQEEVNAL